MTLQEYYDFPAGTQAQQKYINIYDNYWPDGLDLPTDLSYAYAGEARSTVNEIPTSHVTNMSSMFANCTSLLTISWFDTKNVTTMYKMFYACTGLTSLPPIDCTNVEYNKYPLFNEITGGDFQNLTEVGGFLNMRSSWGDYNGLAKCPNLTYQSCINILNGLYDFIGKGETPDGDEVGVLKVNANFLTTVGDDISIGTDKGWTITS